MLVQTASLDGKHTLRLASLSPEALDSNVDDLIKLNDLSEAALFNILKLRFAEDNIYTYVSSILVSVNPFKRVPRLVGSDLLEKYKSGRDNPPHIFAIAANAYSALRDDGLAQSVVIGGESGAGKTEATKLIIRYLVSAGNNGDTTLEQQIVQSNPVMEAFGNAKTMRNNNSSRFGKLMSLKFSTNGARISGASIVSYLLEKSRVAQQLAGERNYHVFYQVLAAEGLDPALKLMDPEDYYYTNQSDVTVIDGVSDKDEFDATQKAMSTLGLSAEVQANVLKVLAAVLHIGNLEVEEEADGGEAKLKYRRPLQIGAELLQLSAAKAEEALTSHTIGNKSAYIVKHKKKDSEGFRDALCKFIYSKLFTWLISKINESVGGTDSANKSFVEINILDIFGFEVFEVNSFEQV
jgi:myosin-5